jgi:hypothetical protein
MTLESALKVVGYASPSSTSETHVTRRPAIPAESLDSSFQLRVQGQHLIVLTPIGESLECVLSLCEIFIS